MASYDLLVARNANEIGEEWCLSDIHQCNVSFSSAGSRRKKTTCRLDGRRNVRHTGSDSENMGKRNLKNTERDAVVS
jgi:hypothetical protein